MLDEDRPCAGAHLQDAETVAFKMLPRCHELLVGILSLHCVARVHIAKHGHIAPCNIGIDDGPWSVARRSLIATSASSRPYLRLFKTSLERSHLTLHTLACNDICHSRHVLRMGSRSLVRPHRSAHACTLPGSPTATTNVNIQHVEASRESSVRPFHSQLAGRSWDLTGPTCEWSLLHDGRNGFLAYGRQKTCATDKEPCRLISYNSSRACELPPAACFQLLY